MTDVSSPDRAGAEPSDGRTRPFAEFMQIWEEGYLSDRISYENMHTYGFFLMDGDPLRGADGRVDRAKLTAYIDAKVASMPDLRLRLQRSALGLTPPAWVPDTAFDVAEHVVFADEVVDLDTADARTLAGAHDGVMPLKHPLWRMRVTELTDGGVALGIVRHHAIFDGAIAMTLMRKFHQKSPDEPVPAPQDPYAGERPATAWQLPLIALQQWWGRQDSWSAAWRNYWSKSFLRRGRRAAARLVLPLRYNRGGDELRDRVLPPVASDYRIIDAALASKRAREYGGSMGDLLASAIISAWDGPERTVSLRVPVSLHSPATPRYRNHILDLDVVGDADDDVATRVASIGAQVKGRGEGAEAAYADALEIGTSTLLPWFAKAAYFCGAQVRAMVPFPSSSGTDQISAAGVLYDGSVVVGVNVPATRDLRATVSQIYEHMTGAPDPGRS
ncbi:wax ester/triacylglycerol synthase domain-containing protein [uncultured Demequina sp.]|uniref:wax ester/triacylglycerol synthase domain-containing protein n=1 Tax=uncultured Demequina sp. TaxID=693499 RepID=UPI0025CD9966|nr:wax ester/triacylglycerol synthase domain-containing protein [uncultured Demequina sp.]